MVIKLQERSREHVRVYFERTRDPEILTMLPQTAGTVEAALEAFDRTQLPGATSYGSTIYADGAYVGDIWCYCIDPQDTPGAMLSCCIFEKGLWGKGIATRALEIFSEEIRAKFGLKTVGAFAYCSNLPSMRVLESSGFRELERFFEDGVESAYWEKSLY